MGARKSAYRLRRGRSPPVKFFRLPPFARGRPPHMRSVGLKLRVLPLTPQAAFALQSGDAVFSPPDAGGFVQLCRPDPLPVPVFPFRVSDCESEPSGEVGSPRNDLDVLVPSSNHDLLGHWVHHPGRNQMPWAVSLKRRLGFCFVAALCLTLRSHAQAGCDPAWKSG